MAGYKRLVSYMYNYENGFKGNNVGYARVESINEQCKITIRVQLLSMNNEELRVFFFKRSGYSIEGIPLGEVTVRNGIGQFRTITESNNIMNSSYELDDIGGIVLYYSDKRYIASEWDDKPITKEMVNESLLIPRGNKKLEEVEELVKTADHADVKPQRDILEEEEKSNSLKESLLVEEKKAISIGEESVKEEKVKLLDEDLKAVYAYKPKETEIDLTEEIKSSNEKEEKTRITEAAKNIKPGQYSPKMVNQEPYNRKKRKPWPAFEENPEALRIYNKYPVMYPFEDNEVAWCVRFEPQDIGILPMENWSLGNNSFLLHGFYCYSHLIFARINDKTGIQYVLGVPGIYHNREKFMAKMFGFDHFKSIKRKELRTGEFGYWYTPIIFN